MVQHVENRLPLGSVDTNEQLHEFQIVHAIITQCRKSGSLDENTRNNNNNHNGYEAQVMDNNLNSHRTHGSSPKKEHSSFVTTICRTFNALAQATNPSLCSKQRIASHPVTIASTVKNIISQFSRPSCHGSLCLASPCEDPSPGESIRRRLAPSGNTRIAKSLTQKTPPPQDNPSPRRHRTAQAAAASTSKIDDQLGKKTVDVPSTESPSQLRPVNLNLSSASVKARSVRARNANGLTRHVSAPIPQPKTRASVRRSKSDAICYRTYHGRQQRKADSNVQTKVLHFENCCKGKGRASMCLECRKLNLKQEEGGSSIATPIAPKLEIHRLKQDNCTGALSYHKPSTITQTQKTSGHNVPAGPVKSAVPVPSSDTITRSPPSTARPRAVACPGGTYFSGGAKNTEVKISTQDANVVTCTKAEEVTVEGKMDTSVATMSFCGLSSFENPCSANKRKHSLSEEEESRNKRESLEEHCDSMSEDSQSEPCNTSDSNEPTLCIRIVMEAEAAPVTDEGTLHSSLSSGTCVELKSPDEPEEKCPAMDDSDIQLSLSDDSDTMDSLSSQEDSALSPRQKYLVRHSSLNLRRTPSSRYQKMRRKLKKLISRPRSYPEVQLPSTGFESQSELVERYIESLAIPAPSFMLRKESSTFCARRQELARRFDSNRDQMSTLPDHVISQIFSYLDTRSLASLKCVCKDFSFIIDADDIRGTDSLWVKDERYIDDPCKFCRKKFTRGDVSMCRYHAKSYHCDLPYGRSYWMCCFQIERNAPGCRTGIHNNHWGTSPVPGK